MIIYYKLIGKLPVPCTMEEVVFDDSRIVGHDTVGPYMVSTVFLTLDHSFGSGPPLLFETMVFYEDTAMNYQTRCSTWEEALYHHQVGIEHARQLMAQLPFNEESEHGDQG